MPSAYSGSTSARKSDSAVVAKRVWTTDRSSANDKSITSPAASDTGESVSEVSATVRGARPCCSACATSVVVPEREIATRTSYSRAAGSSEAGKASVSPWRAASPSAAPGLGHVQRRPAADDTYALAAGGQQQRRVRRQGAGPAPQVGLRLDFVGNDAHS